MCLVGLEGDHNILYIPMHVLDHREFSDTGSPRSDSKPVKQMDQTWRKGETDLENVSLIQEGASQSQTSLFRLVVHFLPTQPSGSMDLLEASGLPLCRKPFYYGKVNGYW
jgi:hypothetical protein